MNPHDEAIDRVLTGLRDAEAPAGMEARILRRLEARTFELSAAARAESGWRIPLPAWMLRPTSTAYIAGGVALASLLAVAFIVRSSPRPEAPDALPHSFTTPIASTSPALVRPIKHDALARTVHAKLFNPVQQADPVSDEDALALSEMLAPSKPAPPLPLTHQEQLLAEVVHKGDPDQLADLKPEVRAKQVEIAKTEFHDFFEPPPAKDNE